ncbi:MAG: double-strand break repair helicase AddA [Phenylobacterium sp.]
MSAPTPQLDPQARAADPAISAFVTANAGSGKTKTMIDRVARLLLADLAPGAILCVTYTKAAAAEMQRRLFEVLGEWSVAGDVRLREALARLDAGPQPDLSRARRLFARALETPGGLKIQTLHAFCEKLLRRFPMEGGISPGFTVMDDTQAHGLTLQARAAVALHALAGPGPIADAYAHLSVELDYQAFLDMYADFAARRGLLTGYIAREGGPAGAVDRAWAVCGFNGPTTPEAQAEAAMADLDLALWRETAEVLAADGGKDNTKRAVRMAGVASAAVPSWDEVRGTFLTADSNAAKWVETAAALKAAPALRERLLVEQTRIAAAAERMRAAAIARTTGHVITLAAAYLEAYRLRKSLAGALDFVDLVERAKALIATRPQAAWVLYKLDGGIDHILVDEAQDTSPDQWAIVRALTDEFFVGAGARPGDAAARQLFVVGDVKQSIYSFQGAQPDLLFKEFEAQKRRAQAGGAVLEQVELLASYRSAPEILTFVDAVFAPPKLALAIRQRDEANPVMHIATREGPSGCVDLWAPEVQEVAPERDAWTAPLDLAGEDNANRRLAGRIASEIAALIARGDAVFDKTLDRDGRRGGWRAAEPQDVLILVRRRGPLFGEILRALKRAGLPVAGADRLKLSEHIVFQDLLALARFIQTPQDDLTLAALLKTPLCGLDDDSLFELAHGRGDEDLWARLNARGPGRGEWAEALSVLTLARDLAARAPPYETFTTILARRGPRGGTLRRALVSRLGGEAEEALDEFLGQVLAAEARGATEFETLAAALAALDIEVKREMEAPAGQVRVMTAHGAKGLEAPIVFLPDMILGGPARSAPLLETESGDLLWSRRKDGDDHAASAARARRDLRAEQESYRLLYVALTRARDRVVLCGRAGAKDDLAKIGGWWRAVDDAMTQLAPGVRELKDDLGAYRRFGVDPRRLPAETPRGERAAPTPAWADAPTEPETPARLTAPSEAAEATPAPAPSPLAESAGLGRFRRGELIHRLLELLPELPAADRARAAERLLAREPDLSAAHRAEMAAAALSVLDDSRFAEVFGPGSRAEALIAGTAAGLPEGLRLSGRVDRLVVLPDRVLVVDFKTNRPAPDRIEDADLAYIRQLALYAAVLGEVFPGHRVEAALVWTDGPKLMVVPENMLAASLAALAEGG